MWEWLSDPQVQKTLGWLGGGLAAVAAGGWAVVKFVLRRPKPSMTITADRGGMAAGRDIRGGMAAGRDISAAPPPATPRRRR
jgi:hypothetical protein